ncbi:long-chain-fatty-acyl-CoA reductase [Streptosporangium becharense]|uniref:long-chain-fatty-acyl-CoA reductase n=1 Tax=Streptosporangium becharense TaxID=1816182 RepID=A0A7W9IJB9_9ACTN|nr:acyl-CoA reductase [Streptosporangium becharense]MBB2911301.1 long-chain-fatty-acyl-CoA reductase [Streptosporangium becharense]MBB5821641.1 long-chain-fatty-acyl-CoA reductase [Streptosporangium becharense]
MTDTDIDLPIFLGGRPIFLAPDREAHVLSYETAARARIPVITQAEIAQLEAHDRFGLARLHIQEIVAFLQKVGRFWAIENMDHPLYRRALDQMSAISGMSRKMAQREFNLIHVLCTYGAALYDMLDAEIGSRFYLDDWLVRNDALVHAHPWGNALHVMVGNVPASSIMSLIRGIITKNTTIAKLPKRDPITALYFALSMHEIDPDHPVTQSMNVLYWPGGDPAEEKFIRLADVACVWGGEKPVKRVKELVRTGVSVLEFGPKSSFALIGAESAGSKKVAIDLAHDIAIYNQEACFSPQMVFVEGRENTAGFTANLIEALNLYDRLLPKGFVSDDAHALVSRARLEALYSGNDVHTSPEGGTAWTVTVVPDPGHINEHPLSRTIYVIPVDDIGDAVNHCTPDTQTIIISPWNRNPEIRDEATLRGASKITEVGLAEWHRIGIPHDNIYPMHSLLRWVGVERGLDYWGKYIENGPIDTTKFLMVHETLTEDIDTLPAADGAGLPETAVTG